MIVKRELLQRMKDFGLNSYESKLWAALLSRGVSTAGELSDISNVPRSRAYDVLESLEKKGFIIVKLGKPIKYLAVPPREVVERVKKHVQDEAERKSKTLEGLRESPVLQELNLLHKQGIEMVDPTEMSGAFRGRDKLYEHLSTTLKNAMKSVVIMTTAAGLQRKLSHFRHDLDKAVRRGVQVRIAAPFDGDDMRKAAKQLNGVEMRDTNKNARFCIVDGKELLLMLTDDKNVHESFDSGIWVSSPYFVKHFENLFENDWKEMKKL